MNSEPLGRAQKIEEEWEWLARIQIIAFMIEQRKNAKRFMHLDYLNRCICFVNYLLFVYDILGLGMNELDLLGISKATLEALIFCETCI